MLTSVLALSGLISALTNLAVGSPIEEATKTKPFRYLNSATAAQQVLSLPDLPFNGKTTEMYAGLMDTVKGNSSRSLFYIFQPSIGKPVNEITVWFNGGPGCSSLNGFLEENGRYVYNGGKTPVINPYSWVRQTNMLWVEYPVGVGFTQGKVTAGSQEEAAVDFIGFFKNFQDFYGIQNYKVYVTGESYAGRYVPYVSAAILDQNDTTYYNLQGAIIYDPCIGQFVYSGENAVAVPFVKANNKFFKFNQTTLTALELAQSTCGYDTYLNTYLKFPPPGIQPQYDSGVSNLGPECNLWDVIEAAASETNKCFDVYEVNTTCPAPYDPLMDKPVYFNRADVKAAIHAPASVTWVECANSVFVGEGTNQGYYDNGDTSLDPIQNVLPQVIEATNRVLVANGDYDFIIITNGTLVSIQNMTFNGKLGFQERPSTPILVPGQGKRGIQHYERGLMWGQTYQSGHFEPEFEPKTSYAHLQWVRRKRNNL